jgi:hypothetical protein
MKSTGYSSSEKAILRTIIYSDIFSFPLSEEEVWNFLMGDKKTDRASFKKSLKHLTESALRKKGDFYSLKGKEENILRRQANIKLVRRKLQLAKKAAYYLSHIPTISFIGVSGGVAIGNANHDDDIDLFIIVKKGKLFVTRLWVIFLLEILDMRRKRDDSKTDVSDKICTNLFIDEASIAWPKRKQDVYVAHEIAQVKPLFERNDTYGKFFNANLWIKNFLPNVSMKPILLKWNSDYYLIRLAGGILTYVFFEFLVKHLQKIIMKRHRTNEIISDGMLAFHPHDYRRKTMQLLEEKTKALSY